MARDLPTSNNSVLARHAEDARVVCSGVPEICAKWIRYARTLLGSLRNRLALSKIEVGAYHSVMPDGTLITVSWDGAINIIRIDAPQGNVLLADKWCLFYLESGLVNYAIAGTARVKEDTTPGILYRGKDDKVPFFSEEGKKVILSRSDHLSIDPMPLNEGVSRAFGLPELLRKEVRQIILDQEKESLFAKISCTSRFPSSRYSGKLQLLIQSMYGTDVSKFKLSYVADDFDIPYLMFNDFEMHFEWKDSAGLWTNPETLDYELIRIKVADNVVTVSSRRLLLSRCGSNLRRYLLRLRSSDTWKDKLDSKEWKQLQRTFESYILAETTPDKTNVDARWAIRINGTPFHQHGWAYSWDGSQAHIVTHELVSLGAGNSKRIARRYTININGITFIEKVPSFSAVLSLSETVEYQIRPGKDLIWYYDYVLSLMVTVVTTGNPTAFGSDAPIYCFYDNDDILRIVRYSYTSATVAAPPTGYEIANDLYAYSILGKTFVEETVNYKWGTVITAGFYCDDLFDARIASGDHEYFRHHTLSVTPWEIPLPPVYDGTNYLGASNSSIPMQGFGIMDGFSAFPVQVGTWVLRNADFVDRLYTESDTSVSTDTMLVFPKDDVRALYYGTFKTKQTGVISDVVLGGARGWEQRFYIRPDPAVLGATGTYFGGYGGYIYTANGGAISSSGGSSIRFFVKCNVLDRVPKSTDIANIETTDYFSGVGSWISFFDPPMLTDPTNSIILWVNHSLTDDMVFTTNSFLPEDAARVVGDYPYFSQFSYVGWA